MKWQAKGTNAKVTQNSEHATKLFVTYYIQAMRIHDDGNADDDNDGDSTIVDVI